MSLECLFAMNGAPCDCGREHRFDARVICGAGVLEKLPEVARQLGAGKVYLLSDQNTWQAAGQRACELLESAGVQVSSFTLPEREPHPDEQRVGAALMHMEPDCDVIIGVGSGVINDIGKMLAAAGNRPYVIVATAPSMDGYASATSSMTRGGLKVSISTKGADVILGDTDILRLAPLRLLQAGLGDMLAKYVSICEWRLANVITGEYYCEQVAQLIRQAVEQCVSRADGLLRREPDAVEAVMEGLIIGGVAMNYAGCSRPASGNEHYISHLLDMRGAALGTPVQLHGIQCAVGTLLTLRQYETLRSLRPNRQQALAAAARFDRKQWAARLRDFLGEGAESMIALEEKERKYDPVAHEKRLARILDRWPRLLEIMEQELPPAAQVEALLLRLGMPTDLAGLGVEPELQPMLLRCCKDIRDKYVLSRLQWDLGLSE